MIPVFGEHPAYMRNPIRLNSIGGSILKEEIFTSFMQRKDLLTEKKFGYLLEREEERLFVNSRVDDITDEFFDQAILDNTGITLLQYHNMNEMSREHILARLKKSKDKKNFEAEKLLKDMKGKT